jgi:hypothetical protein
LICIKDAALKVISIFKTGRAGGEGVAMMKRSSAIGIIAATALCCAAPLSLNWYIGVHTMVRQQQAQATTPPPADVHIGTEAFAVAGTKETGPD